METTTRQTSSRKASNRPHNRSRGTEDALALLAGAAFGTAAMFLFDPESGRRRRRQLGAVARDAWDITGETV